MKIIRFVILALFLCLINFKCNFFLNFLLTLFKFLFFNLIIENKVVSFLFSKAFILLSIISTYYYNLNEKY